MESYRIAPAQLDAQIISMQSLAAYKTDLDNHLSELSARQRKVNFFEISEREAEKHNAESLLLFHEKLTNFLRFCNVRIITQEERRTETKLTSILSSIVNVQSMLQQQKGRENDEVLQAIVNMKAQVSSDFKDNQSVKINELLD